MNYLLLHWHEVAYLILGIIFVAAYVVHFLPTKKGSKLGKFLEVETILMVVLIFVAIIAVRVEKITDELDKQSDHYIETLDDALRGKGLAKVRHIESASVLNTALNKALERTTKEVRLARLREMSVDDLLTITVTRAYTNIGEWADAAPGRVLYHVVNVGGDGMERWFEEECTRMSGSKNLGLKKIESSSGAPRLNFTVFDDREAFIMAHPLSGSGPLSGPLEATKAVHIEDKAFASYMVNHFDQILKVAEGCGGN